MPKKSDVWKHFTSSTDDNGKPIGQAKCNRCHTVLKQESANGTSNLWRHFNKSHRLQEDGAVGASRSLAPPAINPSGSGASSKESIPGMKETDEANRCLARMIVYSGHDPAIVEDKDFRYFARCLNPEFEVPSRCVVEEICDGLLDFSWNDLYDSEDCNNFSLSVGKAKTMDREVLYIAAHYFDHGDFEPYYTKKVLFAYEVATRDGYHHGPLSGLPEASLELVASNILSDIPEGAGLFMMACAKTDVPFVHKLKERMKQAALGCQKSKEPFCAIYMDQVIHSIASCLLPDLEFIDRMYSVVSNLKLTRQGRKDILKQHGLDDPWEYNELWYSCYCSLEVLRKGCFSTVAVEDFEVIGILCDIWRKLYRSIKRISDTEDDEPTSHLCLAELFKLREALWSELGSHTVYFVDGLRMAIAALDETIQDSYLVWSVPLAMDPRYKLEYIEVMFETAFGSEAAADYIAKVQGNINDLYSNYDDGDHAIDRSVGSRDRMQQAWNKRRRAQAKTDLEGYLQDTLVPEEELEFMGILKWWRSIGLVHYPNVALMAWNALAMPTCSRLSSVQIARVRSRIRGYLGRPAEEEEEEDDDVNDGNVDAMIQDLAY